jgi:hypothetical protein
LKSGDPFPEIALENIHGRAVAIPDRTSLRVHLQFRRFAGCPICNLHLQTFVKRHEELAGAGVHEVVGFHSPKESLLPYQGSFPFDLIGDPKKTLYQRFGVETSVLAILNPKVWSTIFKPTRQGTSPKAAPRVAPWDYPLISWLLLREDSLPATTAPTPAISGPWTTCSHLRESENDPARGAAREKENPRG